ncbi:hypothetical protein Athai_37370 [Actinocatenispora thailandica]|uniref:Lipoyl-binding domain-containing protein n=1 Tax=Actinocatenispora thailandica TaxID=227318 RepID=A0A7R7DQX2_9ACTN|nr:hypothetical protein Athai_37370 [Actinocatenispora thailandica]
MTVRALAVDFGTSNTVAVTRDSDGRATEVLFDGSPLLPSAVFAAPDGELLTGRDAMHSMRLAPERFEPNPKLRVDDGTVLLGDTEVTVERLFAAVLRRVADEAHWHGHGPVVLTHPAGWGPRRQAVLVAAADRAGLPNARLVAEPVAAAHHLTRTAAAPGRAVVYDLGAGTADVSVVADGTVLAAEGLPDAGGLDVDTAIVGYLEATYRDRDPAGWDRLRRPATAADRRTWRQLAEDVRTAKEMLSRTAQTFVHIPLLGIDAPLGRDELERIATPLLLRTIEVATGALTAAGVPIPPPSPVLLVGGASRMPLVATLLHRHLKVAPTLADRPDLAVALGALLLADSAATAAPVPVAGRLPDPPPASPAAPSTPAPPATPTLATAPAPAPAHGGAAEGTEVAMPALGESVTEGTVTRWLKQVGESVEVDEPLLEVSTDKVDTEIPSPAAGTVLDIKVQQDQTAGVGTVLAIVGSGSPAAARAGAGEPAPTNEPGETAGSADKPRPDPVTYTKKRHKQAIDAGSKGSSVSVVVLVFLWLFPLISNQLDEYHGAKFTHNVFASAIIMCAAAVLAAVVSFFRPVSALTVGPDALRLERRHISGAVVTITVPRHSIERIGISTSAPKNRLVVWCRDGHTPDGFARLDTRPGGGSLLCNLNDVTKADDRTVEIHRIGSAIEALAGAAYAEI